MDRGGYYGLYSYIGNFSFYIKGTRFLDPNYHNGILLTVRDGSERKEIILNGGLFDRGEIKRWVKTLNSRCV